MKLTAQHTRLTGLLFILPLLAYGFGNSFLESAMSDPENQTALGLGIVLVSLNSVIVAILGFRLFPVIQPHKRTAVLYCMTRLLEALLLLIGLGILVSAITTNELEAAKANQFLLYQLAMLILGIGSVFFCLTLYQLKRLPAWLAIAGLIGYALLAIGSVAELIGFPIGIVLSIPGGLFELTLGIWLLVKGWKPSTSA